MSREQPKSRSICESFAKENEPSNEKSSSAGPFRGLTLNPRQIPQVWFRLAHEIGQTPSQ